MLVQYFLGQTRKLVDVRHHGHVLLDVSVKYRPAPLVNEGHLCNRSGIVLNASGDAFYVYAKYRLPGRDIDNNWGRSGNVRGLSDRSIAGRVTKST